LQIWSKDGQVGEKLTNLVKLVKGWSSWSKVGDQLGQIGQRLVGLVKNDLVAHFVTNLTKF
jgi:uncharacterized protein YpuA (DUF1002 family)